MWIHVSSEATVVAILAACWMLAAPWLAAADETARSIDSTDSASRRYGQQQRKQPIGIEELTFTARKREERLQEVPQAASAFSATALRDADVRRLEDLEGLVPNLAFDATAETSRAARAYVRGVGNGDSIAGDPGVGIYLDGVYLARAQPGLFTISDIDRVEVLRGPQGTLFGRNTIGGAVNVITRKPTFDGLGSTAEVRVGNYDRFDTRLSLNVPLIPERAAARVSFASATRDGFQKSKSSGPDLDDDKLLGIRTQLLAVPNETLEIMLALDGTRENRKPQGYKCKVVNRFGRLQNAQTSPELAAGDELQGPPSAAHPFLDACAEDGKRDVRSVSSEQGFHKEYLKTYGATLTASWSLTESLTLKSISAWRGQEIDAARNVDVSQELQLSGRAFGGKLNYVTGLFWLAEQATDGGSRGPGTGQAFELPPVESVAGFQLDRLKVDSDSHAAFGQGTYDLTDKLSLTVGARLTAERKRIERNIVCQEGNLANGTRCATPQAERFFFDGSTRTSDISPITSLKYEIADGAQLYGTWSRGFKSGGFNGRASLPTLTDSVDDEKLTSYELGFKALFLDNRIRMNGALFYGVYKDIQLGIPRGNPVTNQLETLVTNAGRAEIKGAELEVRAVPYPGLELSSALGVTRAGYTEFHDPVEPNDPMNPHDPEDRLLVGTPSYTLNVGASYQLPLGSLGEMRVRTAWSHVGRSGTDVADSRILRKGKHGELDAQLAWMLNDGVTELVIFGSNILDREYVVNGVNLGASFGSAVLLYNAPRTYGLEVRRSF